MSALDAEKGQTTQEHSSMYILGHTMKIEMDKMQFNNKKAFRSIPLRKI